MSAREAWHCRCGCNNQSKQVDCYSCGKPRTEGEVVTMEDVGRAMGAITAAESAGIPKAVAERDVLGVLTPAQYRAQTLGEPHAAEPAGCTCGEHPGPGHLIGCPVRVAMEVAQEARSPKPEAHSAAEPAENPAAWACPYCNTVNDGDFPNCRKCKRPSRVIGAAPPEVIDGYEVRDGLVSPRPPVMPACTCDCVDGEEHLAVCAITRAIRGQAADGGPTAKALEGER